MSNEIDLKYIKETIEKLRSLNTLKNYDEVNSEDLVRALQSELKFSEHKCYEFLTMLIPAGGRIRSHTFNLAMFMDAPTEKKTTKPSEVKTALPKFTPEITNSHLIPKVDKRYVKFGNYSTVEAVIDSGQFAPIWITGLSGNGKTYSVEQACANLKREIIMINISNETNEEDLIGSFSLETTNSYEIECDEDFYEKFLKWSSN